MALSRKLLESMGLEADKVASIIEAHSETVDALKEQITTYKDAAKNADDYKEKYETAQKELDDLKKAGGDWQAKCEKVTKDFEAYKMQQTEAEAQRNKAAAYKKLLKDSGISDKRIDAIMRVTDLATVEMDGENIKDADKHQEQIKKDWEDFIVNQSTSGAQTPTPPANNTGVDLEKLSMEEYIAARKK